MSWAEVKMAVKSIQRGYAVVTNADVTITLPKAVDPSRCIVLLDGNCGEYVYKYDGSYRTTHKYHSSSGLQSYSVDEKYGYAWAVARKPYVKALTETQLTIGQSGTYSNNNSGSIVSYQVIEFFN